MSGIIETSQTRCSGLPWPVASVQNWTYILNTSRKGLTLMPASTALKPPRATPISETAQAAAGLRTFARIADKWKISARDAMALLGVESRSTYYELLKRARESKEVKGLNKDQLDRLSYLLGIYEAIRVLFPHS